MGDTKNQISPSQSTWARFVKRPIDILAATCLIVLLLPVVVIAVVAIKTTSKGPLLFHQERAGRDGVNFRMYKLRTMKGDRRPDPKELVPLDHAEITSVGRWLRRFKIDELPQLISVIKGDMSLIGPRPTLPDQVARYDEFRKQRLIARPGITGLAQVYSNPQIAWDERILYDIAYVRRCSFYLDLTIFIRTFASLLAGEAKTTRPFSSTRFTRYVTPPDDFELQN